MQTLQEAHVRHARHYLRVVLSADALYKQGGSAIKCALDIFDRERANIDIGQQWTATHADRDDEAAILCGDYANASVLFLNLRMPPSERARWLGAAILATRRLNDREAEGWHTGNLGRAYREVGEARMALDCFQQVLTISREVGDCRSEAMSLSNMASARCDLNEPLVAVRLLEEALPIIREVGDREEEGGILGKLGTANSLLGRYDLAIDFYRQQLTISQEIGALRSEAEARVNIGIIYRRHRRPDLALKEYEAAFSIYEELDDFHGIAATYNNIGLAFLDFREYDIAIQVFDEQLAMCRSMEDVRGEAKALFNKALTLDEMGHRAQARPLAEASLEIFAALGAVETEEVKATLANWDAKSS
jgi:tetratricopeptide (TPR) repeat protein